MVHPRNAFLGGLSLAALLAAAPAALAADYLRGAYGGHVEPTSNGIDWSGVYAGGQVGYSSGKTDFTDLGQTLGRNVLPNLAISDQIPALVHLGQTRKQGTSYGAFIGMNYLWDDVVLGFEGDYTRSAITASSSSFISRMLSSASTGTDQWDTRISANARSKLSDWGTIRGRAGWAAGNFMPFITAGLALGNITSFGTSTGSVAQYAVTTDPLTGLPVYTLRGSNVNTINTKHRGISYGGAIGAGLDMAFFSNFFVRAEWQYIQFASGGTRPEMAINTARVAGALKF